MKRLLFYALAVILGAVTGFFIWVWPGAWPGLTALGLALVVGLFWLAQRFPKPRFTGGRGARVFYVISAAAVLFTLGVAFFVSSVGRFPCPPTPQICEFNTYTTTTKSWLMFVGGSIAFLALLAGLMASEHEPRAKFVR
jgi:hypothetical protein